MVKQELTWTLCERERSLMLWQELLLQLPPLEWLVTPSNRWDAVGSKFKPEGYQVTVMYLWYPITVWRLMMYGL